MARVKLRCIMECPELKSSYRKKCSIAIHIFTNISRSKGNQAIKFGQLIEYNIRNIFLKNHTQNVVEKLFPGSFLKNQN